MYALKWESLVILLSEENDHYEYVVSEWEFPFLHWEAKAIKEMVHC